MTEEGGGGELSKNALDSNRVRLGVSLQTEPKGVTKF
jgi:hypothetical protein